MSFVGGTRRVRSSDRKSEMRRGLNECRRKAASAQSMTQQRRFPIVRECILECLVTEMMLGIW